MIDKQIHNQLRQEYNPDGSELRTLQLNLLEILVDVARICEDNGIHYFLAYGTMIGAVRHEGFIPWDDDVDIFVPQSEIKKLKKLILADDRYDWQDHESDVRYFQRFFKVRSRKHFINEPHCDAYRFKGLFVDIFPMEKMPDYMPRLACRLTSKWSNDFKGKSPKLAHFIYKFSSTVTIPVLRLISALSCQKEWHCSYGIYIMSKLAIKTFDDARKVKFENHEFLIPTDFDKCLTETYGNYMELPDVSKRLPSHSS